MIVSENTDEILTRIGKGEHWTTFYKIANYQTSLVDCTPGSGQARLS